MWRYSEAHPAMGECLKPLPALSFRSAPVRFPTQRTNEVAMLFAPNAKFFPRAHNAAPANLWLPDDLAIDRQLKLIA
jgi:hypothetical protein